MKNHKWDRTISMWQISTVGKNINHFDEHLQLFWKLLFKKRYDFHKGHPWAMIQALESLAAAINIKQHIWTLKVYINFSNSYSNVQLHNIIFKLWFQDLTSSLNLKLNPKALLQNWVSRLKIKLQCQIQPQTLKL